VKPAVGSRATQGYESALDHVGRELRPALRALDDAAADLRSLSGSTEELPALQYALHVAAERVLELSPAAGAEEAHADLGAALEIARDETGCVWAALEEHGPDEAAILLWEWRVALFGVRIALREADGASPAVEPQEELRSAYLPVVLLAAGVAGVLGGALADLWPLWMVGLALVAASAIVSHGHRP
jgi:hypothetical protein